MPWGWGISSRPVALAACLLLLGAVVAPGAAQSAPPEKLAASIERIYGPGAGVDTVRLDSAEVYRVSRDGALLGFAEVVNSKGKDRPITYLVATDSADALRDVDILVYREPRGGEVAYEPWRKQFRGKSAADPLQVGKDIRNVSGATISAHSVTRGVRRALAAITRWHAEGKLK